MSKRTSRSVATRPATAAELAADPDARPSDTELLPVPMTADTLGGAVAEATPVAPDFSYGGAAYEARRAELIAQFQPSVVAPAAAATPDVNVSFAQILANATGSIVVDSLGQETTPATETPAPAVKPNMLQLIDVAMTEAGLVMVDPVALGLRPFGPADLPPTPTTAPAAPVVLATTAEQLTAYLDRALALDIESGYLYVKATAETVRLYYKADKSNGITFATAIFCELVVASAAHAAWQRGLPSRPKGQWGTMKQRLAEVGHVLPTRIAAGAPRRTTTAKPAAPAVAKIDTAALTAALTAAADNRLAYELADCTD